jgi:hypothetical protein|tara:strand:+ start:1505 stop:1738 length:234 start_codon:yes stop_codon:yes gene_type:complete
MERVYSKSMGAVNKLTDYEIRYSCFDDCKSSGCPTHVAKFHYGSASETFCVEFGKRSVCFNSTEFRLIQDFIERLNN